MATTDTPSTALDIIKPGGYLALNHDAEEMAEMLSVLAENLGGEALTARDLPRLGIPSGGGVTWEIPTGDGDMEPSKTLTGIIVHFERTHSYWPHTQASGTPPICQSVGPSLVNGKVIPAIGIGEPGGPCVTCPFNTYGTKISRDGKQGDGKACTERENWFLLIADRPLPIVLSMSPASLSAAKDYRVKTLGSVGKHYSSVVTSVTLATDTGPSGDKYSYVVPVRAGNLGPDEIKRAREYAIALRPVFAATSAAIANEVQVSTAADVDAMSVEEV